MAEKVIKEKSKRKLIPINVTLETYDKLVKVQQHFKEKDNLTVTLLSVTERAIQNGLSKQKDNI